MGVVEMLDDAKKNGGTQVYKGDSRYVRGKKINLTFQGQVNPKKKKEVPAAQTLQELPVQLIAIDGEMLSYRKTINLECCPGNLEVLFDPQAYFSEHKTFLSTNEAESKLVAQNSAEALLQEFDQDKDGELNETEFTAFKTELTK